MQHQSTPGIPYLRQGLFASCIVCCSLLFWVGCNRTSKDSSQSSSKDLSIKFDFFYRENSSVQHSISKSIQFEMQMPEGDLLEMMQEVKPITVDLGDFIATISPYNRSFTLDVFEKEKKQRQIVRQLFQLDRTLENQLSGQHGFTGLVYVNHSKNDSELQFYGRVVPE